MKSFNARFYGNPRVYLGLAWLALVVIVAVFAGVFAPRDPFAIVGQPFLPPGSEGFLLGTDSLGRNVMAGLPKPQTPNPKPQTPNPVVPFFQQSKKILMQEFLSKRNLKIAAIFGGSCLATFGLLALFGNG